MDKSQRPKDSDIGHNDEFGFLYKSTKMRPITISKIALVPEFMDALRSYDGHLDNKSIYELLRKTYLQMLENGDGYRFAKDTMNKVSKDIMGDSRAWRPKE